jgi:hypothetical protein
MQTVGVPAILVAISILQSGCGGVAAGIAGAAGQINAPVYAPAANTKLMIFGGMDHRTYLGCLNCSQYAPDSVLNQYGLHGSQYAVDSIFNRYGAFGSPYSNSSACNPYASDPPVVVDGSGRFYGRLTVNQYSPEKIGGNWAAWIAGVCQRS